jgi:hypothetical protein
MLHLIPRRYDAMTEETRAIVGRQLVDLLALALQSDERTLLTSGPRPCAMAHLARIEAFVRRHIDDPDLAPRRWRRGCGISVRYLHELLRDTNQTLGQWIRDTAPAGGPRRPEEPRRPPRFHRRDRLCRAGSPTRRSFRAPSAARFGVTSPAEARGR